jgi:hypothetical protein
VTATAPAAREAPEHHASGATYGLTQLNGEWVAVTKSPGAFAPGLFAFMEEAGQRQGEQARKALIEAAVFARLLLCVVQGMRGLGKAYDA